MAPFADRDLALQDRCALDRLELVRGWGMAVEASGYVYRPSTLDGLRSVLETANRRGVPVVLRGAGRSYGDAALLPEAMVLSLERMRRILAWDPQTGVVDVEPGVSIRDLWRFALGDGWWPAVVPGTMYPTLGGCLAMNVHGKNNWVRGTVGEHCEELDLLLPSGEEVTVSPDIEPDLFHGVIGSFGQLALIKRARLRLKRVESGLLEVRALSAGNLEEMLTLLDEAKERYEYVVGWVDAFAGGGGLGRGGLGRGQVHLARHLDAEEDPSPAATLRLEAQDLPDTFFGVLPKSLMWRFMKPMLHRPGMRLVNAAKYRLSSTLGNDQLYRQSLAAFSFLLDYVPGWKRAYLPGGLIQHQSFVPAAHAAEVFGQQLRLCQKRGMPSYLAVLKRHRRDPFLLTHAVEGYSLALDFPVTSSNRQKLWRLVAELAELTVEAGGRFYPAKDAALPGDLYRASFDGDQLQRFAELRQRTDPDGLLRSSLADRLLP